MKAIKNELLCMEGWHLINGLLSQVAIEQAEDTGMKFSEVQRFAAQHAWNMYARSQTFTNVADITSKT